MNDFLSSGWQTPWQVDQRVLDYRNYGLSNPAVVPGSADGAVKISVTGSTQVWIAMNCTGFLATA